MASPKKEHFTIADQEIASIAKALSHPARVAILRMLSDKQGCVCGELVESLPLSQSTVSQHLKELKVTGLIQGEIEGPRTCYCIAPDGWAKVHHLLNGLLIEIPLVTSSCNC